MNAMIVKQPAARRADWIDHLAKEMRAMREAFADFYATPTGRVTITIAMIAMIMSLNIVATYAQTATPVPPAGDLNVGISFTASDLDIFFTWFNTMFRALLPIALLGAGIMAGGAFVWVVARMLGNAFMNMLNRSGGGARA